MHQSKTLYSPYKKNIESVLDTAGGNRAQIETFLYKFNNNHEKMQAAEFLTANLPPCDSATLPSELLIENLDYAFLARESTLWGKDVSWADFLNYVLPHRVSQEEAVKWRKIFYQELLPIVSKCKTMREAVLAVNLWCFSKTGFESTQRWDQNPLMTINRGYGRCEEAVIFTVCALRSVGIPARQAMVPAWQHSNDNHTWTEVLIDGKWHYLESANPDYGLDYAWFSGSVRKAPLVESYAYGNVKQPEFPVLGRRVGCTLLNTTSMYAPASRAEILVTDSDNKPLNKVTVYFSVFNYASLRPVAAKQTDENGKTSIILGPGSVFVSAAYENATAYAASTWIPGEETSRKDIQLKLSPNNKPEGTILFRFNYSDKLAQSAPAKNSEGAKKIEFDSLKKDRLAKFEGMKKGAEIFDTALSSSIAKAGLNTPEILEALNSCSEKESEFMAETIRQMETADLIKISSNELISNADLALKAREDAGKAGLKYDDKIFTQYVLSPRIMYEQLQPWRSSLYPFFRLKKGDKISDKINSVSRFVQSLSTVTRGPLGNSLTPLGVFTSNRASNDDEINIFAVAALRSAGIPARYLDEQGWAELFDGQKWTPFYPEKSSMTGKQNATAESTAYYSNWRTIKFGLNGFPKGSKPPQYFKDFTISKLENDSFFQIVEKTISGSCNENIWEISIPNGEYYLISGTRNANGEPTVSLIPIKQGQ
ncbi:transglutaminase domain-containing protein [Desulfovibrio gilichinskyi]|uniref:Transglutaminase-like superfamily protein n=1 Tax=Desulfovibrio gilichinskyi TaxID=1519643 RepID=A0A1X7CXC6_9BACT|nr:transglutaminase domain-containing protein [Desulfovibrio gilichinskyi]SMF04828.1 Transglutaminase-like superfamily protein [Desulfovibrio gilichinskyi]